MERLDPKVIILFFVKNLLATIHIIPIWFIGVSIFENIWPAETTPLPFEQIVFLLYGAGIIFLILLILAAYYWSWVTFSNFSYGLENDGFHIRRGIVIKRNTVIPYTTIENIELFMNPLVVKFLGLYSLCIKTREQTNTAGLFRKAHGEIIPGLTPEAAQQLRNELIKLSHVQTVRKTYFDPITGKYS
jgi:membrane protein YdbS with pleckstrin-like domain